MIKKNVPKTNPERKLYWKYKKLLANNETYEELQKIAADFKADLAVFLPKSRRYGFLLVLVINFSFGQNAIVAAGGNSEEVSYTIAPGLNELQIAFIEEETTLGVPNFEVPIIATEPKSIPKKRISFFEKIIEFIKQLITKKPKTT